jgi:acetyltransferase-like isoleucine patch superfamily enzyme
MSTTRTDRRIPNDWYDGALPDNLELSPDAHVETAFSFALFRGESPGACSIGHGASVYLGTMFDVGRHGRVTVGSYVILNGPRIVCDAQITIGDFSLIAWGVVLMDSYRVPRAAAARREVLRELGRRGARAPADQGDAQPIHIGSNVWIGFDTCILPGVAIGDGTVVGARSVVTASLPPYCIAAGNPAHVVRRLHSGATHG